MASDDKWCFTKEQLENTPSRQCGIDAFRELVFRQQAGNFIQDMGQRLKVTQLCINTAIVYMHRFFVFHSFTQFPWNSIAAAALFLAAKVEEQPRKLEHVIRVHQVCRNIRENIDVNSERYQQQCQDLVFNENILLQTLGFDVAIDHPHTHVVRCCHLVGASKDLAQTSYFMASNSLHLTTMCLQYKPTVVACFCIHLACKWSNWEIPLSNEDREWFTYVDPLVTSDLLKQLTEEFLKIFDKCPQKLKEKIMANGGDGQQIPGGNGTSLNSPFEHEPRRIAPTDESRKYSEYQIGSTNKPVCEDGSSATNVHPSKQPHPRNTRPPPPTAHDITTNLPPQSQQTNPITSSASTTLVTQQRDREYREKKERERLVATAQQYNHNMQQYNNSGGGAGNTGSSSSSGSSSSTTNRRPQSVGGSHHGITPEEYRHRHSDKTKMAPPSSTSATSAYPRPQNSANPQPQPPQRREAYRDSTKREHNHLLKPNAMLDSANGSVYNSATLEHKQPAQCQQQKPQQPPVPTNPSHQQLPQHQHQKPYLKQQTHDIKKLLNSTDYDQHKLNSNYLKQQVKGKQEHPSPAGISSTPDSSTNKSVPNSSNKTSLPSSNVKQEFPGNGYQGICNSNGSYNAVPPNLDTVKVEQQLPKKPSMFSPEKTPPRSSSSAVKQTTPHKVNTMKHEPEVPSRRTRTMSNLSSSSSEPELRPVIKKIDQVEGFENILRDNTIRTQGLMPHDGKAPDMASMAKPDVPGTISTISLVNGIETNPILISNLLKETSLPPMSSHLSTITSTVTTTIPATTATVAAAPVIEEVIKEHHHHKERKKKSKDKHRHKDKDKDRSRHTDEGGSREKKKKHKDKDKDRHRKDKSAVLEAVPLNMTVTTTPSNISSTLIAQPIKITIPRDKIQPTETLKIKISKDRINTESIGDTSSNMLTSTSIAMSSSSSTVTNASSTGLKIKIAKISQPSMDSSSHVSHVSHVSSVSTSTATPVQSHSSTTAPNNLSSHRKRDRDSSKMSSHEPPPNKMSRSSGAGANQMASVHSSSGKQNGRNSSSSNYHKVSHMQNANHPMVGGSVSSFPPTYHQQQQQQQMRFPPPIPSLQSMQHMQGMRHPHPQQQMAYNIPNQYMTDYGGYYAYVGGGRFPPPMYHHDPTAMLQAAQMMGYPPPGSVAQGYGQPMQAMAGYGGGALYSPAQPQTVAAVAVMPPPLPTDAPPELPPPPPPE